MARQHDSHYQTLDAFAALGAYQVRRVERAVQDHVAAQACRREPNRTVASVVREVRMWLRLRRVGRLRSPSAW